ncbi:MAG: UDP-N-acetylglucosamine 2-epimerase (non-hydrolyzing), partial [Pyrinomonadaceae bacterium]|nr:UDP-N-acetylglucosamine 2-epimerase (non-hydrolyzing) [Pyrinomonadaceae bacterium]
DDRVPEEVNRRIIDHSSTILLPYTARSKENLIDEGIPRDRVYVTGNPIFEVLNHYSDKISSSNIMKELGVSSKDYFLVTLHRSENVDERDRLQNIFSGFEKITDKYKKPLLISVHPRTAAKLSEFGFEFESSSIRLLKPLGFFDFVKLEKEAFAVLTDSGTVQEECSIFGVPNVTVRDVTERPETLECGSNVLAGAEPGAILRSMEVALESGTSWVPPGEYLAPSVSETIAKIVLGYTSLRQHHS